MGACRPLCRLFGQVRNLNALDVIISTLSHSCAQLSSQRPLVYAYLLMGGIQFHTHDMAIVMLSVRHPDLLVVILYGSVARHEESPLDVPDPSDVDLLALLV